VLDDLEWARAHLRYGGTVVIPAPDAGADDEYGAHGGAEPVKHSLGRLLPPPYKRALQNALDDLMTVRGA